LQRICPKSPKMDRKKIYHITEWIVALAACGYLIYRLAIYDDYAGLWTTLCDMEMSHICALLLCVLLMPVNMSLEAWRWKTLMNEGVSELGNEGMSWREAHRQVYYSKLAGLVTPWRLGEYPARALLRNEWSQTLSMGAVGSATMTAAIVIAGLIALAFSPSVLSYLGGSYLYALAAVILVLALAYVLMPKLLQRWVTIHNDLLIRSTAQSFVRLACWCVQLYLVLFALGALGDLGVLGGLGKSAVYYLLVTITPNVPIAEVGVRGAWAIWVFGSMNAALAGVLLWAINTLLPCLIWPFLRRFR